MEKINELVSLNVIFVDIDQTIAVKAGELRMRYGLPTGDSLIAATGLIIKNGLYFFSKIIAAILCVLCGGLSLPNS